MVKVATLSFQHAYNYGAVFQVKALQHIISQLGAECDIIDYRCPAIDSQYDFKPIRLNSTLFGAVRANLVLMPFIQKKKRNFQNWMNSYKKTQPIYSKEDLISLDNKYDKFIVGSDQVWNLLCHNYDKSFFLDFVSDNSKKLPMRQVLELIRPIQKIGISMRNIYQTSKIFLLEKIAVLRWLKN